MFQGHPAQENTIFAQKWPKNPNLAYNFFLGSAGQFKPPLILQVLDSKKHVLQGLGA